jgi:hypothetical protein
MQLTMNGTTRVNLPSTTLSLMGAQLAGQAALPAAYPPGGLRFPTFNWWVASAATLHAVSLLIIRLHVLHV